MNMKTSVSLSHFDKKLETKLNSKHVGMMWEKNAKAWIFLSENGYDVYRDYVNTPAFCSILPDINELCGIDIGCGTGYNTNILANMGAKMIGIDISPSLIKYANKVEKGRQAESGRLNAIIYSKADAVDLPFFANEFDFATSFHCLMDILEYEQALSEIFRVLKPGGFLQFSIPHPCFWRHKMEWIKDNRGNKTALSCRDYFTSAQGSISEWGLDNLEESKRVNLKPLKTPIFTRTLAEWFNTLIKIGFVINCVDEPSLSDKVLKLLPALDGSKIVPFSLIIRCYKPVKMT
jgi:SAM-dependent methyltransferase